VGFGSPDLPLGDADVGITGMFNQFLAHPCAKIGYPTGNNGGLFVKADGPGSGHGIPKLNHYK
jgi:hypothetical protein